MNDSQKRVVLMDDPYNQPDEPLMEFRITYEGLLLSTQKDAIGKQPDTRASHKHDIRKVFHYQLKRLWEVTSFLNSGSQSGPIRHTKSADSDQHEHNREDLSIRHASFGFNFIPLVTEEMNLICGLDILFLRPDVPGKIIGSGDIDNRLKTLFDALRIPVAGENYRARTPLPDESPMYCLLEDDKLITKVTVETDQLLQFVTPNRDVNETRLVITVRIRPYKMHTGNMQFG